YSSLKEIKVLPKQGIPGLIESYSPFNYYTIPNLFSLLSSFLKTAAKTCILKTASSVVNGSF
ncbi:MAG: hypothetical protein WAV13_11700, partial [Thermodesulfovibrionales bacterium]